MNKNIIITALMLIMIRGFIFAYTFINSVPLGADVYREGKKIGVTPMVLKSKPEKAFTVLIKKDGFRESSMAIRQHTEISNFYTILTPDTFSLYFPGQTSVNINHQKFKNQQIENVPSGFYFFKTGPSGVSMKRVNPNRKYLVASLVATGVGLATGIIAHFVGNAAYEAYQTNTDPAQVVNLMQTSQMYDAISWTGYGIAGLSGAFSIYFGVDAYVYNKKNKAIHIKSSDNLNKDSLLYNHAMDAISANDFAKAQKLLNQLIGGFPESKFIPVALMRRADIEARNQQWRKAVKDLKLVKNKYPIYEIYELALKALSDDEIKLNEYDDALSNLAEVRQLHQYYNVDQVDLLILRAKIERERTGQNDSTVIQKLVADFVSNNAALQEQARALLVK